jgi:hypothetical protein
MPAGCKRVTEDFMATALFTDQRGDSVGVRMVERIYQPPLAAFAQWVVNCRSGLITGRQAFHRLRLERSKSRRLGITAGLDVAVTIMEPTLPLAGLGVFMEQAP